MALTVGHVMTVMTCNDRNRICCSSRIMLSCCSRSRGSDRQVYAAFFVHDSCAALRRVSVSLSSARNRFLKTLDAKEPAA